MVQHQRSRVGVTPVIAIVLLLILTLILTFVAWEWGIDILNRGIGQAEDEFRTSINLRGLSCEDNAGDDGISVLVFNRGDTTIDTSQVDLFVYDADGNMVHSSEISAFFSADELRSPPVPSSEDREQVTYYSSELDLDAGQLYEVEFVFPNANDHSVSDTCRP